MGLQMYIIEYNISKRSEMILTKYFTAIRKAVYKSTETKYFSPPVRRVTKAQEQNRTLRSPFLL